MRNIQIVPLSEKENMREMLNKYLIELFYFDKTIKFKNGLPEYKWFDCYWQEKTRTPLYFYVNGKFAGFALIRELEIKKYEIAEFCVFNEFRGGGNALWFAEEICKLFVGQMEFGTNKANLRAVNFWRKFVKNYKHTESEDVDRINWTIF